jgi:hypothetical protein
MPLICPKCRTTFPDEPFTPGLYICYMCSTCHWPLTDTSDPRSMPRSLPSRGDSVALCDTDRLLWSNLKREALLFDKLGYRNLPSLLAIDFLPEHKKAELGQLYKRGLIVDVDIAYDECLEKDPAMARLQERINQYQEEHHIDPHARPKYTTAAKKVEDAQLRLIAAQQSAIGEIQASPLFNDNSDYEAAFSNGKAQVLEIVLNAMPEPDATVPWEQISEFKADSEARAKLLGLKVWISEVTHSKLTPLEIAEKLEWWLQEYERHLRFHRMKVNHATFETVVTVGAEVIEDVFKFRLSKLTKLLFSANHRELELLEAEMRAPGKQLAYIFAAKQAFPG